MTWRVVMVLAGVDLKSSSYNEGALSTNRKACDIVKSSALEEATQSGGMRLPVFYDVMAPCVVAPFRCHMVDDLSYIVSVEAWH